MAVDDIVSVVSGSKPERALDILASVIDEYKADLATLEALQKQLMEEAGEGFVTQSGGRVVKRSRTTQSIDVEMFYLTDKDAYLKFAQEGKLTVPVACIKELEGDRPYITKKTSEYFTLRAPNND